MKGRVSINVNLALGLIASFVSDFTETLSNDISGLFSAIGLVLMFIACYQDYVAPYLKGFKKQKQ